MLFILEQYLRDRRALVRQWEHDRSAWIKADEIGYRNNGQWQRDHPYPVFRWRHFLANAIPIVVVGGAVGILALTFIANNTSSPNSNKSKTSQQHKQKYSPKVGDKVQVIYGTYKDTVGELVKVGDDDVILRLTNSTWTKDMCRASTSCSSNGGVDNGGLLRVASFDNITPYKDKK